MLRISIASDHRGVHIKRRLVQTLTANAFTVFDEGTHSDQAVDYPDFAQVVAHKVSSGEADRGILICGTGIGMSITANKFAGVRAASCYDEVMVEMSRRHNDVNVLCLPGDMIGERPIDELVLMWLKTEFDGGRHAQRVDKIAQIEGVHRSKSQHSGHPDSGHPDRGTDAGSPARSKTPHE
jgi:ribose 5-phosphate isomerase B